MKLVRTCWLLMASLLVISVSRGYSQSAPDAVAEAEGSVRAGAVSVATAISGYSGTGYVANFRSSTDKITITISVPASGFYKLLIRYRSEDTNNDKTEDLFINGSGPNPVLFPKTSVWTDVDAGKCLLNAGSNTITIQSNWGWVFIDKFSLYAAAKNTYNITPSLINPNVNSDAKSLYAFLVSKFNKKIISGSTDDYCDTAKRITGKTPMLRAFDFQHYTQGYAYLWKNGGHTFGWDDNGQTQKAIDWYNNTGKIGIVSFQWHWHSPSGGNAGTNTFYTNQTTFDVSLAVQPGTTENTLVLRDVDSIATQLKKLQTAGVPVLWRPLHEAGGAWFWWGAKGPGPCKKLYHIVYDRLTNHHGLNNLIWVWSTPEADWFPKNDSIDIIGYDSYPGAYTYATQKATFDKLYSLTGGTKLIAMSENGPIPNPDNCLAQDAPWSYFMTWSDVVKTQNTYQHDYDVFNNPNVLTIENPTLAKALSQAGNAAYRVYPNPAKDIINLTGEPFTKLELLDIKGQIVYSTFKTATVIPVQQLSGGIYILRIYHNQEVYQQKLMVIKE